MMPDWLRLAWAAALAVIVLLHGRHVVTMPGQRRRWHFVHALMAAVMVVMYLVPRMSSPTLYRAGVPVLTVVALAVAAVTAATWWHGGTATTPTAGQSRRSSPAGEVAQAQAVRDDEQG